MAGRILTAAEIEMLGLPLGISLRGWRIVREEMIAYPVLADGSEGKPVDLVPLAAFLQRENR